MSAATTITNILWHNNNAPGDGKRGIRANWTGWVDTADGTCITVNLSRAPHGGQWTASGEGKRGHGRTRWAAVRDLLHALAQDKDEDRLEFTAITALTLARTLDYVGQDYVADGEDERVHPSEVLDRIIYLASQHLLVDPNFRPDYFRQAARTNWRAPR